MTADVVIAVRGGRSAKSRCASVLAPDMRERLVEAMLGDMLDAAVGTANIRAVHVVTPTQSLARLARDRGARVIVEDHPTDLNGAFDLARAQIPGDGAIVLLPGDLPALQAAELSEVIARWSPGAVILAPAKADGGTGALVLPAGSGFATSFGHDSFLRHRAAAGSAGLRAHVVEAPGLAFDIDRPSDLEAARDLSGRTGALLRSLVTEEAEP